MSRILDLQQKAQSLLETHQSDIDRELSNAIKQILSDMKATVRSEAQSLSTSIDSTRQTLSTKQSEATAEILTTIEQSVAQTKKQYRTAIADLQQQQQLELEHLKASLQASSQFSQDVVQKAKLKKALFTSNLALISLACIMLISAICLGYVSKSKYTDIKAMQNKVEYLKSQGGSMNIQKCGNEKKWRWCVQIDPKAQLYNNNYAVVQETN